jgi:hypothetical protein
LALTVSDHRLTTRYPHRQAIRNISWQGDAMPTKRAVTGLIATAMAAGAFMVSLATMAPTSNYSTDVRVATQSVAALGSSTGYSTSTIAPDTVHDI